MPVAGPRLDLADLPGGQRISYRVRFQDLSDLRVFSEPIEGSFLTPSRAADRDVTFAFSGDCVGQGWGIDLSFGGMKIYGFWYSHVGWIVGPDFKETDYKVIGDYAKYPELMWLNKHYLVPPTILALIVMALGGWVNGGSVLAMFTSAGFSSLFIGFFLSTVILYHGTFSINSI